MKKILIVDDEKDVCSLVKKSLEKTGQFEVETVSEPQETLKKCLSFQPDLILLDLVMPNLKGTDIITQIRSSQGLCQTKIIITSGYGEMVYVNREEKWHWLPNRKIVQERGEITKEKSPELAAQHYGVDHYLAKPFSAATLLSAINDVLKPPESPAETE